MISNTVNNSTELFLIHRWDPNRYYHAESEWSNGSEEVLQTLQIFRTRASQSDAVLCHSQETGIQSQVESYQRLKGT